MPQRTSGYLRTPPQRSGDPKGTITSELYALVKGRKFGSWITAGGRSVGFGTTDLIENPAYIFESIFRDAIGLAGSALNTTSIDDIGNTASGRRTGWKLAASLTDQKNSADVIKEVCEEAALFTVSDYANKVRLIAIDHYGPALELNTSHVAKDKTTGRPIVRVRQTHPKYLRNEFFLNYRLNRATGNHDRQRFLTDAATNMASNVRNDKSPFDTYTGLCAQSKSMYNITTRYPFNSNWIRDDATADLFLKTIADWLAIRKWEVQATLPYGADSLSLEALDQVLWNIDLLPVSVRNATVTGLVFSEDLGGGSLAAGDYYYRVAPVDNYGEGKACAEVKATVSASGQPLLIWNPMTGATKYRLYGRTTGSQDRYWETTGHALSDNGGAGTAGTPRTVAPGFFVTDIVDDGLRGGQLLKMQFVACPTIFFLGGGYGYDYGEIYGQHF
jgi:hypothetical protein